MREYIRKDIPFTVNVLPGFEDSWVAAPGGIEYMQAYWAKNLYWFTIHMTYGYGLEGARMLPDKYVSLVPPDYRIPLRHSFAAQNVTTNASAFWRG